MIEKWEWFLKQKIRRKKKKSYRYRVIVILEYKYCMEINFDKIFSFYWSMMNIL